MYSLNIKQYERHNIQDWHYGLVISPSAIKKQHVEDNIQSGFIHSTYDNSKSILWKSHHNGTVLEITCSVNTKSHAEDNIQPGYSHIFDP